MKGDEGRRDRLIQDHLDGRIDEDELRRRLGEGGDGELDRELAAYRTVWAELAEEPESRLGAGFARRVARAATTGRRPEGGDRVTDALLAASVLVPAAAAVAGVGVLLPAAGVEVAPLLRAAGELAARLPAGAWAAAGSAAALCAADRAWTARRPGPSRSG